MALNHHQKFVPKTQQHTVSIVSLTRHLLILSLTIVCLHLHMCHSQRASTQLFDPTNSMTGQFPPGPWSMFSGTGSGINNNMMAPSFGGNPLMRSPFMNSNAFLGSNYNSFNLNGMNQLGGGAWSPGRTGYYNPYGGFNNNNNNNNYFNGNNGRDELYTAIGYDRLDPNSQMRLTITERPTSGGRYPNMGMGFGMDDDDFDRPTSWYVQGSFLTSQLKNKAGTYHVVLTTGGRTADGCVGESLGEIARPDMMDISNPFNEFGGGNRPGILPNKLLVGSSGPTVYASTLDGVSRRQIVGAALAACEYINNGVCGGYIPFCATITKDVLPAMEVPLANSGSGGAAVVPFNPNVLQGGFGQQGLGNVNGGLSFTDPFAANNPRPTTRDQNNAESSASSGLGLLF